MAFAVLFCACCVTPVFADSPSESAPTVAEENLQLIPPSQGEKTTQAIEAEGPGWIESDVTDPAAAKGISGSQAGREEALEMLMGVFGAELESAAGPFDELHIEKFLSDNVAVIPAGLQPEIAALEDAEDSDEAYEGATLLASSLPLRPETGPDSQEPVDLGLRRVDGQLEEANPLVEVGVPTQLGEGIDLAETGVSIKLAEAPSDRAASTAAESVAFYPNVADDTDFAVAPTPTGVETFTQVRSETAPHVQKLTVDLPESAQLLASKNGGAKIMQGDEPLVDIPAPTAIDAYGASVPIELKVEGSSLILEISPKDSTKFPILIDPLFQTYEWQAKNTRTGISGTYKEGWSGTEEWSSEKLQHSGGYSYLCSNFYCNYGTEIDPLSKDLFGLWVSKGELNTNGDHASWIYTVPRYFTDQANYGERPHSFINHMTLSNLTFGEGWSTGKSPYLVAGLWDQNNGWVSLLEHEGGELHGLTDMGYQYQFSNLNANTNVKLASAGLWSRESGTTGVEHLHVGAATLELAEPEGEVPSFGNASGPSGWVDQTASKITFTASEAGLGIYAMSVNDQQNPPHTWKTQYNCTGVGGNPCPHTWASTESGPPALKYEPAVLPQGINYLTLKAEDPLGHVSSPATVQVKVDHTAPNLTLSGSLTEQAKLGWSRPSYNLNLAAADGSEATPQAGVVKAVVEVDGKGVYETSPGCSTKNCAIAHELSIETSKYEVGQHAVKVTATDGVGLSTTKTLTFEVEPPPVPTVSLAGSMAEQATRGTSRARYELKVHASAEAGETFSPATSSSFGTAGSGTGQFNHPAGVAVDGKGGIWVVDEENDRVEKFNEAGTYVTKFGASGAGDGQFGRPTDVAVDPNGNLWVTDAANDRVEEFNEKRVFVRKIGGTGSAPGQLEIPEGIAIDAKGNIWVADTGNQRLQEFSATGQFIKVVTGGGILAEPTGIDIGAEGKIWVADRAGNRVEEFNEAGELLSYFGTEGTGRYQFVHPDAIDVDSQGDVWVGDEGNDRVIEFSEEGEYLAQFGSEGSEPGQFSFAGPMGIGTDTHGNIWVADSANNRVQKWQIPAYVPSAAGTFGTVGTGPGQFKHPAGIDLDANGNIWVVDKTNSRLEEFSGTGEYENSFGVKGTENGQLTYPTDVAIDASGNLWVADAGNCRIEKFTPAGQYLAKIAIEPREGICKGAEGLAIDASGNLWVADTNNRRVQEFTAAGKLIKSVGSTEGPGQLLEPKGIDIGPDGKVWVTDWAGNRVVEFTEAGAFVRQFGSEGAGPGQFKGPDAIEADSKGNIWVGDERNYRVQEFNKAGEYVAQFGTSGTGEGQFSFTFPMGLATDDKGNIWVSDTGHNKVQRWNRSNVKSEISTEITVDGKAVDSGSASCPAKTCPIVREWVLESSEFAEGKHLVQVKATDGLGWSTTKTLTIELTPPPPPSVGLSGTMTEQATLGTTRPRYKLNVSASTEAGEESTVSTLPTFVSSFGSSGSGNGQFSHPAGIAVDSKGNLWVVDEVHYRVEKFNEAGEYLTKFGSSGTANGKFSRPTDVAIDAKGNLWVTDAANNRIEEFNEAGEYITKVGTAGSGNLQFSGPESIAIDPKGNIWVGDTYNHRVQELNEKGEFIRAFGTYGTGQGQIVESTGIAIGPGGNVWVADWGNNRVEEFSETGEFIRQFGTAGSGSGQFKRPDVIDIDTHGNVWVGDEGNNRVQEFNQSGEYVTQFGTAGTADGKFSFGWPFGVATDSKGRIWVADSGNDRVQRWQIPNYVPTYSSSFGTAGTGKGQLAHPAGIAADAKGNVWVADEENHRVQKFNKSGEYVAEFGSEGEGDGQFARPTDVAIDPKGNLWVTDARNNRIEEFSEAGKFIRKVGSLGAGQGQFQKPESLAIDPQGHIWIGDTYNGRVQELNEKGEFIRTFGTYGSGQGQIAEAAGIAIGPGGNVWVADWGNNRVEEFSETGDFIRQFGSEGTGNGQFKHPDAIDVDTHGDVWVGDEGNERIQEFNQSGEYVTQFGAAGSGPGQFLFSWPMGIASDPKGHLWIADSGNSRVQNWSYYATPSEIEAEVTIDGKKADSSRASCTTESCSIADEWALESSDYSAGKHTVQVKALDGFGRSTTKSLSIQVQRDTTKPTLEVGGELANAPEGWVEQDSYGLTASATDQGGGVTSLAFKIDGQQIASANQSCPDGGCEAALTKTVNMSPYSGGTHVAELVAVDGATNTSRKVWNLNVDPNGHVSAEEVSDTLDAADNTSESTVMSSSAELLSIEERLDGNNPGLDQTGELIESTGTPTDTTIATDPTEGFTIYIPESAVHVEPVDLGEVSSQVTPSEDVVAVSANTSGNSDTILRPVFNGLLTFGSIRDASAAENFSWKVQLAEGQTLKSLNPHEAEVDFEDGTSALVISTQGAHDAVGAEVSTSLSVTEGNVITLTVHHREEPYVYPVVAGTGWEGGYVIDYAPRPLDELEIREEEERIAREKYEQELRKAEELGQPAPEYSPDEKGENSWTGTASVSAPAQASSAGGARVFEAKMSDCQTHVCEVGAWRVWLKESFKGNGTKGKVGGEAWHDSSNYKNCDDWRATWPWSVSINACEWIGNHAFYGYGNHFCVQSRYHINRPWASSYAAMTFHNYGDGYAGPHWNDDC
ncbi:MAG TPA: SMP-30/gluconolactonase/LRE family protein [Solirubrobacterales bacterium]